jgi:CHAD domain-containing protein
MHDLQPTSKLFTKLAATMKRVSSKPTPEAVHRLRTTIRRIETLIAARKADDLRAAARLLKQLARLRRRAGKVRDLDVQMDALRSITLEGSRRDKASLTRHLEKIHSKRERKLTAAVGAELSSGLTRRWERVRALLGAGEHAVRSKTDYTGKALHAFAGLVQRYRNLDEKNLHQFRLRCKRIRYLAELDGDTARSEPVIAALKRIQDSVGEWHDWVALTATAEQVLDTNSPLLSALRTQRRSKFLSALRTTEEAKQRLLGLAASLHPSKKEAHSSHPGSATDTSAKFFAAGAA